jgi:flagellar biogenesis protein FliO
MTLPCGGNISMWQQAFAILLVLGLLIGTLALLRRRGLAQFSAGLSRGASRPRQMQVIEKIGLTPQHSLHLVNVREDLFLIGVSPSGCDKIAAFGGSGNAIDSREQDR